MLKRLVLAVLVGVVAALVCVFLGTLLVAVNFSVLVALGSLLKEFAVVVGFVAGLWYFLTGERPVL